MTLTGPLDPTSYYSRNATYWASGDLTSVIDEVDTTYVATVVDGEPVGEDGYIMWSLPDLPSDLESLNSIIITVRAAMSVSVDDNWQMMANTVNASFVDTSSLPATQQVSSPTYSDFVFTVTPNTLGLGYVRIVYNMTKNMGADAASLRVSKVSIEYDYVQDTTPPNPPTDLAVSEVGPGRAGLTWTASAPAPDGDTSIYEIERAPDDGGVPGTWIAVDETTSTSFTDGNGGTTGDVFWYRIRARDDAGNYSAYDGPVSVTMSLVFEREYVIITPDSSGDPSLASQNGINWYDAASPTCVAFGKTLHAWVPRAELYIRFHNTLNEFQTSPDGASWTTYASPASTAFTSIADNGTKYVAVGNNGNVWESTDLVTWTQETSAVSLADFEDIVWADDISLFVAVGSWDGSSNLGIWSSPDALTWTLRVGTASYYDARRVRYSTALGRFVVVTSNAASGFNLALSDDGINWGVDQGPGGAGLFALEYSPELDLFVTTGTFDTWYSTTGIGGSWTAASGDTGGVDVVWSSALDLFIAVSSSSPFARYSTDAITWSAGDASIDGDNVMAYQVTAGSSDRTAAISSILPALTQSATAEARDPDIFSGGSDVVTITVGAGGTTRKVAVGADQVSAAYVGNDPVTRLYLGDDLLLE